ncbi:MAG: FAD-dependent oxidoreductase [Deltaproteobacteria bacterium]|nr:FAD-dependent oxidoreductase [Deltaproteobacteria bacterium]
MPLKIIVIGAVALGPKAAVRLKRLAPDAEVTMIDRDAIISYGGCGIPYFISGDVSESTQLTTTSFHMVRDTQFFRKAKGVEVLTRTEALAIDRVQKKVRVRSLETGEEKDLPYDKLLLATGSIPNRLDIPGAGLDRVFNVSNLGEAVKIRELIANGEIERAVIVGAGSIGLEMAEAMADLWGIETTVIEIADQVLPGLIGSELSGMVTTHLNENETEILLSERVERLEGAERVERVVTNRRTIEADIVVMAMGVRPNVKLAQDAGLELTDFGGIKVNSRFMTSDPNIYAGGDCIESMSLITERPVYLPLGSLANRQGRIIGTNLSGAVEEFDGAVGSFIVKVFDLTVAGAGLNLSRARAEGFDAFSALVVQGNKAHFFQDMELLYLELVVDRRTGRVLGIQGLSPLGDALAARVDAVAALLKYKPLVRDVSNLEIAYSPPYSAAMDVVNNLGNVAENILAGRNEVIDLDNFANLFSSRDENRTIFLDVRGPANAKPFVEQFKDSWVNIPQEELENRMDEIPGDKDLIAICNNGTRSYEALLALKKAGKKGRNLQGGVAALKKWVCKTSNFVEIAKGEKLTRRNITKYFEDLILSLTYAAAALAKRRSWVRLKDEVLQGSP